MAFLVVAFSCIGWTTFEFIFYIIYSMGELYPNDLWMVSLAYARAYYRSLCFLLSQVSQVSQVEITLQHYKDFGSFTEEWFIGRKKMSRCFTQNDTLFRIKRHVVFHKTTRCFLRKREWNGLEVPEMSKWMLCFGASSCILVVYEVCVTLVTAKSAKSLLRVRARVWESGGFHSW